MTDIEPNQELSSEVLHYQGNDILLNPAITDPATQQELINLAITGIESWYPHIPYGPETMVEVEEEGDAMKLYVDDAINPRYFAKVKRNIDFYRRINDSHDSTKRKNFYAFASLRNELKMAQDIEKVCQTEDAAHIAQKYGFKGLQFAAPLVGIINRQTAEKVMIYPFIEGIHALSEDEQLMNHFVSIDTDEFIDELGELFKKFGISAYDLEIAQFILSPSDDGSIGMLNLIDTEAYARI